MKRGPETNLENLPDQVKPKRAAPFTYDDFIQACETGNLEEVEEGIQSLSLDVITSNDNTPLRTAAYNGHLAVVNRLLEIEAVKLVSLIWGGLSAASKAGHLAVVNRLLEINAVSDEEKVDALYLAAIFRKFAVVNRLLDMEAVRKCAEGHSAMWNSILHAPACEGQLALVNRLLEIDKVREYAARGKNSVLRKAAKKGHLGVVRSLLKIDAVREMAAGTYENGFMNALGKAVGWAFGNNVDEQIETLIKKLAEKYPNLKTSLEKEKRKNEARALYFAFKAANRRDKDKNLKKLPEEHSHLKSPLRGAQWDVMRMISTMVKNSPPPAKQAEGFFKRLRLAQ